VQYRPLDPSLVLKCRHARLHAEAVRSRFEPQVPVRTLVLQQPAAADTQSICHIVYRVVDPMQHVLCRLCLEVKISKPAAPEEAKAASGLGQGDIVDTGKTCWEAPTVFYFVKNDCATAIPVTIKVPQNAAPHWGPPPSDVSALRLRLAPRTWAQAGDSVSCCRCRAAEVSFPSGLTHGMGMTHGECVPVRRCTSTRTSARA
jgi:hypothetical protein